MFVATVDFLPDRKYKVLGITSGNRIVSFLSKTEFNKALEKCIEEARSMGASTCVIGTAIKFLD